MIVGLLPGHENIHHHHLLVVFFLNKAFIDIHIFRIGGIQRACQTAFLALGQAKFSLFIALLRKIILLVPLALILPRFMGVFGIYWAEPIADTLACTTCGLLFLFNFKRILAKPPKS